MIIDCHGHYTTAPAGHQAFREAQLRYFEDPSARITRIMGTQVINTYGYYFFEM